MISLGWRSFELVLGVGALDFFRGVGGLHLWPQLPLSTGVMVSRISV